jgi:hypothetical protein
MNIMRKIKGIFTIYLISFDLAKVEKKRELKPLYIAVY